MVFKKDVTYIGEFFCYVYFVNGKKITYYGIEHTPDSQKEFTTQTFGINIKEGSAHAVNGDSKQFNDNTELNYSNFQGKIFLIANLDGRKTVVIKRGLTDSELEKLAEANSKLIY